MKFDELCVTEDRRCVWKEACSVAVLAEVCGLDWQVLRPSPIDMVSLGMLDMVNRDVVGFRN